LLERPYAQLGAVTTLLLLAGLYLYLRAFLGPEAAAAPRVLTFRVSVAIPRPGNELPMLEATRNDSIVLVIASERSGEVHVHGYEEKVTLKPGNVVTLKFPARDAGFFAVHFHEPDGSMYALATLEVQPR
jgi:hypothetical protein